MIPDPKTKIMARLNKVPNNRAIRPYNRYFERTDTNAICLAPYNPDPRPLLHGLKDWNMMGAITVAFEQELLDCVDDIDPVSREIGVIGFVTQKKGIIKGYAQGGYGLFRAIQKEINIDKASFALIGAGHLAHGFIAQCKKYDIAPKMIVYNRTVAKAETLAKPYPFIADVRSLDEVRDASGDILVNCSNIGSPWSKGSDFIFPETMINRFSVIVDVNFIPIETPLIELAKRLNKVTIPGWKTFLYATQYCFETILDIRVNTHILGQELVKDFRINWS